MFSAYLMLIPRLVLLLVYLAGLVVAILLLVRAKSTAAILAAVAFGLLILVSLGQIVLSLPPVAEQLFFTSQWLSLSLSCCCSLFDVAAIVCLIVALWQAVSGTSAEKTEQESFYDETWEEEDEVVDVAEQTPDEATYATEKLETPTDQYATEVLEGEVIEETPPEAPRVTQVLDESPEEKTVEGEILESTESPYATKVLSDTPEETAKEASEES